MKKRIKNLLLTTIALSFTAVSFSQEITEENYLKVDKEIWATYDKELSQVSEYYKNHHDKKDSLKIVSTKIYEVAQKENCDAAIKYALVPSGLQRLFMVRLYLSKDTLLSILKTLPQVMQNSDYGKSLLLHINSKQIEEGDKFYDFEAIDSEGNNFLFSKLTSKNILLLYGGLDCMGETGRDFLKKLYNETDREHFQIVIYWPISNLESLKELASKFNVEYLSVSDFLKDSSPVKILYGAQATPTCFLIDERRNVIIKSLGLPEDRLTEFKEKIKF